VALRRRAQAARKSFCMRVSLGREMVVRRLRQNADSVREQKCAVEKVCSVVLR
jgi:hypothetical protein